MAVAIPLFRESSLSDVLGEIVPDVGAKVLESAKAMGFAVEALEFDEEQREWEGL